MMPSTTLGVSPEMIFEYHQRSYLQIISEGENGIVQSIIRKL